MTSIHATLGTLALACYMALMSAAAEAQDDAARPQAPSGAARNIPTQFDIPAQPLRSALDTYGSLTGLGVLVDSALTQRNTTAIHGEFAPQEALRRMLAGTGLRARYISVDTITIQPAPAPGAPRAGALGAFTAAADIPGIMAGGIDYRPYIALMQTRIKQALCRSANTRPGRYRLLVQLWIGASGSLQRARVIGSTGDDARDRAVGQVIRDLKVDPPPASMAQPLVMLLEPAQPGSSDDCWPQADAGRSIP